MTGPPTIPGQDLNPGFLSLEESALLTELMRLSQSKIVPLFCIASGYDSGGGVISCHRAYKRSIVRPFYYGGIVSG